MLLVYVFCILFAVMYLMPAPKEQEIHLKAKYTYLDQEVVVRIKQYSSKVGLKDPLGAVSTDTISKKLVADSVYFKYWSFSDIFTPPLQIDSDADEVFKEIESIEEIDSTLLAAVDSIPEVDTLPKMTRSDIDLDKVLAKKMRIQYPDGQTELLFPFFRSLGTISEGKLIRVFHFGDSQIEGDRITSRLRHDLQEKFGGCGVGMVQIKESNHMRISVKAESANNWQKRLIYGSKYDKEAPRNYSFMGSYFRYNDEYPEVPLVGPNDTLPAQIDSVRTIAHLADSIINARTIGRAWFKASVSKRTYASNQRYENFKVLYGRANNASTLKLSSEQDTFKTVSLPASTGFEVMRFAATTPSAPISFTFEGKESPYIYGVTFDCNQGVAVDNIALRGSSGVELVRLSQPYLREQVQDLNVKMIIFQFGVNSVPGEIDSYGYYYSIYNRPLRKLKQLSPDISILVIGISDMSKQVDENFVTYPNIAQLRRAQKKAAFDNGCAYFDLFEAMGGENSMPAWVEKGYAASDYTHFSSSGASKVSKMLFRALMLEYEVYKKVSQ